MVQAYILIQADLGKATAVATAVREITGVTFSEDVTGPYDVIAHAEAETLDDLGALVIAKIQETPGITRTLTCTVVRP